MIRKLLGVVVLLALPALLTAQTPVTPKAVPAKPALTHGIATQVQGDVVITKETDGQNNQEGRDKANGQDNDQVNDQVGDQQEGVDQANGQDNDQVNDQVGDQQEGVDQGSEAAPPAQNSQIGRHKP